MKIALLLITLSLLMTSCLTYESESQMVNETYEVTKNDLRTDETYSTRKDIFGKRTTYTPQEEEQVYAIEESKDNPTK